MTDDPNAIPLPPEGSTPPLGEIGTALAHADSMFADYLDPTMGSISWWEARDLRTMLRVESQARKVEQVLTMPIISAPLSFTPGKGDRGECEWYTEVMTRAANNGGMTTPLGQVVAQMTTAVTYRVASFEKVWGEDADAPPRPGRAEGSTALLLEKLAYRPASNTRVVRDRKSGAYRGLIQDPPYGALDPIKIRADRAFTYTHGVHREPVIGSSDLEIPLVCWKAKQKLRFLWFLFLELHAQPKVAFSGSGETNAGGIDQAKAAAQKWTRLRAGGAIALDANMKGDVLETSGHAADLYMQALKYLDGEMTGQVLAQFADLAGAAASGIGSFALSRDQSDFYMMTRRYTASEMGEQFDNFVTADVIRHNFGRGAAVPRLKIGPLVRPDLKSMLEVLQATNAAASLPGDFVSYVVEQTALALDMPIDRIAAVVKATTDNLKAAATTERQAKLAEVAGPVNAAESVARKVLAGGGQRAA